MNARNRRLRWGALIAAIWLPVTFWGASAAGAVPIELALRWRGTPCNASGAIDIVVRNIGSADVALPAVGGLGYGSLFMIRVRPGADGPVVATLGDGFNIPYDYERLRTVTLRPGQARAYAFTLFDAVVNDEFSRTYQALRMRGGRIGAIYALHGPEADRKHLVVVGRDLMPAINSNTLTCAPQQPPG